MSERLHNVRDRFVQFTGARWSIADTHARSDAGAAAPIRRNQAFLLQFGVCARHGVGSDAEIACQLAYGGQCIAGAQFATFYQAAKLIHDLLKRREIRIDCEIQLAHDAEEAWRPRYVQYKRSETPDSAHVHQETLSSVRCNGSTVGRL